MQELLILFVIPWFTATFGLVPSVARSKGYSGVEWFFIALFVTPLLALLALVAVPVKHREPRRPPMPEGPEEFKWRKD